MRQSRINYNKTAAGKRISSQRKQLGLSRGQIAEPIGKTEKYYSDIERGYCGMSLETMIGIADVLGVSLDYITFGEEAENAVSGEAKRILFYLNNCEEQKRKKALEILQVYLAE